MSALSASQLLTAIDPMTPRDRRRLIAETALTAADGAEQLLVQLDGAGWWGRQVALQIAGVARSRNYIRHCLANPDPQVALRAWSKAVRFGFIDAAELPSMIADLPAAHRQLIMKSIRRCRAVELADALVRPLRHMFGDVEAAAVLTACSPGVTRELLPELAYVVASWSSLAKRHPDIVLGFLDELLSQTPRASWRFAWDQVAGAMVELARRAPGRVLDFLERGEGEFSLPHGSLGVAAALARHDPHRTLKVVLDPRYRGPALNEKPFFAAIRDLADQDLIDFARTLKGVNLNRFLSSLAPARRSAVFNAVIENRDLGAAGLPMSVLDLLPAAGRAFQARRLLGFRSGTDDPNIRLRLLSRLEWPEPEQELRAATARPLAADRSAAYQLLINAAGATRESQVLEHVLTSLTRLTNEQDPVRMVVLEAIATLPAHLLTEASIDAVQRLSVSAVQARDCSWGTKNAVHRFASLLLIEGALRDDNAKVAVATALWEKLGDHQTAPAFGRLDQSLPKGGEHHLYSALASRISFDARRGIYGTAIALAAALRRRAWGLEDLQKVLASATSASDDSMVRQAVDLWLADPASRSERVQIVVRRDPSTITLDSVKDALAFHRTDLLAGLLGKRTAGRFLKEKVRHVPLFEQAAYTRWSPSLLSTYRELLVDWLTTPNMPVWERVRALRALAPIRESAELIRGFCDDPEVAVAESALTALSWTDDPATVMPELLARVAGPQARVAMYSATRAARFVPPSALSGLLWPVLTGPKITSRKEAVRLLAAHHVPDVVRQLIAVWHHADQHRDVRRAIVAHCHQYLDHELMWELLAEAASDTGAASALMYVVPTQIPDRHRRRYLRVLVGIAHSPVPTLRILATQTIGSWGRWDDGTAARLLSDRFQEADETAYWRPALQSVIKFAAETGDGTTIFDAATSLINFPDAIEPEADRDQPVRQRQTALADLLSSEAVKVPALRAVAIELSRRLAADLTLGAAVVRLAVAGVDWAERGSRFTELLDDVVYQAAQLDQTDAAASALRTTLGSVINRDLAGFLLPITADLLDRADPAAGRLALSVVEVAGDHMGWTEPWRELLIVARRHSDHRTRIAALNLFIRAE